MIKNQDEKDKRIVYLSLSNKSLNIISSVAATGEDILIIGSGNTVHNLRLVDFDSKTIDSWSKEFDDWLIDKIENKDLNTLNNYKKYAPHASLAVPTADHLVPLFIALGISSELTPRVIFRDYQLGNLSYLCYEF